MTKTYAQAGKKRYTYSYNRRLPSQPTPPPQQSNVVLLQAAAKRAMQDVPAWQK